MLTLMDQAAADWIRDNVLPRRLVERYGPMRCPCQYGMCGACARGRHDRCLNGGTRSRRPKWETHIIDQRGFAVGPPVWRTGTPCRYRCPCVCPPPPSPEPPPVRRRRPAPQAPYSFGQMALFDPGEAS